MDGPHTKRTDNLHAVEKLKRQLQVLAKTRSAPIKDSAIPLISDELLPAMKILAIFLDDLRLSNKIVEPFEYIRTAFEAAVEGVKHPLFNTRPARRHPPDRVEVWSLRMHIARLFEVMCSTNEEKQSVRDTLYDKLKDEILAIKSKGNPRKSKKPSPPSRVIQGWVDHFRNERFKGAHYDSAPITKIKLLYKHNVADGIRAHRKLSPAKRQQWIERELNFIRDEVTHFTKKARVTTV